MTSDLSFTSVQTAGAHWFAEPVHPFFEYIYMMYLDQTGYILLYLDRTGYILLYLDWTGLSCCIWVGQVRKCCIWIGQVISCGIWIGQVISRCTWNGGQVRTDALCRFNRTAVLKTGPFEIKFGWISSNTRPKLLWYRSARQCRHGNASHSYNAALSNFLRASRCS